MFSEHVSIACIASAIVIIIVVLIWALRSPRSCQQKQIWNPTTRSWYHIPDPDDVFPMMSPINENGRHGRKYYRDKYRRWRLRGWIE